MILAATNKARSHAQKLLDFEPLRCAVDVDVSYTAGGDLRTAVLAGTTTPVRVNRIERAFVNLGGGNLRPIELTGRSTFAKRFGRIFDNNQSWTEWIRNQSVYLPTTPNIYRHGHFLHPWPVAQNLFGVDPIPLQLDVVAWADEFATSQELSGDLAMSVSAGPLAVGNYSFSTVGSLYGNNLYNGTSPNGMSVWLWKDQTFQYWNVTPAVNEGSDYCWRSAVAGPGLFGLTQPLVPVGFTPSGTYSFNLAPTGSTTQTYPTLYATDFFFDDCDDWMMFWVLRQLEYFKRGNNEHFVITQKMLDVAWEAVVSWNNSTSDSSAAEEYSLD